MLKLIKYEVERRYKSIGIFLVIMAIFQAVIITGIYRGGKWIPFVVIFMVLSGVGVYFINLFDGIRTYYKDLNSQEGYMLFLTPNSGYKVVGSKLIVNILELSALLLISLALLVLDFNIIKHVYIDSGSANIQEVYNMLREGYSSLIPNVGNVFVFAISIILQFSNIIMTAFLAITLTKTVFSNTKKNGILSFGVFIALNIGMQILALTVFEVAGLFRDFTSLTTTVNPNIHIGQVMSKFTLVAALLYMVYISISYFISSKLLNDHIDL